MILYKIIPDGLNKSKIEPEPKQAAYVKAAFENLASNLYPSMEAVRKELLADGFKCSKNQFTMMLRNPVYIGKIFVQEWNEEPEQIVDAIHKPIIDEYTFYKVQEIINPKDRKKYNVKKQNEHFPLRGFLVCFKCGQKLTASRSKGNGGTYYYYHCQNGCKERYNAVSANSDFITYIKTLKVAPQISELYMKIIEDIFKSKEGDGRRKIADMKAEQDQQREKLDKIDNMLIEGEIDKKQYNRMEKSIQQKIISLDSAIFELKSIDSNFPKYLKYGFSLLSDIDVCYDLADVDVKQKIIGSIFHSNLVYERGNYRTTEKNEVLSLLTRFGAEFEGLKRKRTDEFLHQSYQAAPPGLEPGDF